MKIYLYLISAILVEILATSSLNSSEGFKKLIPGVFSLSCYAISFYLLSKILVTMPVGIVYALWSGAGIVLMALIGYVFYGQKLDIAAISGILLIVAGVLIINVFSTTVTK
ncbi:SMR family transporter [Klebsiella pneumoniae]|uniref:SMR family transporter n=1 Tax=Klebsiella pneumoniae TaxID=573 RepID=UPI0022AD77BD|nr:SMR family transporter [Klebsiella pneumoniae]WRP72444.1 SMR family transporter [Klebsiella pneumoniae]HCT5903106.1 QacE family quaternary ammonium compound efflux SMR transporter [Klebsiella pneumoniae]